MRCKIRYSRTGYFFCMYVQVQNGKRSFSISLRRANYGNVKRVPITVIKAMEGKKIRVRKILENVTRIINSV